jgi:hypothetical protein
MSSRKLIILGVVAVLMVLWAVVQSRIRSGPGAAPDTLAYLVQGLDPADIGSIVLGAGDGAVTLKREGGRFVVASKDNYPANPKETNNLLTKCLEIRTSQFITDNPANHEDLGVTEQKARSVVKFLKPDSSVLTGVIVGKDRELGEGNYVRLASSDKVYIAPTVTWFSGRAIDYIEQELISARREDIQSVTVTSSSGQYTLKAGEDGKTVVLENIPAGKRLKSSDSETVFGALTSMRFDDVKKSSEGLSFEKQFVCRLKDSTVYTVKIAQKDNKTYVTCQADFTDTTPVVVKEGEVESDEQLKKKEAKLLARDKAKEFAVKHQSWVYEIPEWKSKHLTKQLSDLLEDEPKPTEKAAEPNAVTAPEPNAVKVNVPEPIKVDEPNQVSFEGPDNFKFQI